MFTQYFPAGDGPGPQHGDGTDLLRKKGGAVGDGTAFWIRNYIE